MAGRDLNPPGIGDLVGPGLQVLFCGINPGTLSGELHLHFARPGNRFWKLLAGAGFTDRVLAPEEQHLLPGCGVGITNLVAATTASAAELTTAQLREGGVRLEAEVTGWAPEVVAVLGMQAYRTAYRRPRAGLGLQPERLGPAAVWLLPNPSGLQARYQLPEMVAMWQDLRAAYPTPDDCP